MMGKQNIFDISMFLISTSLLLFVGISYYSVHAGVDKERSAIAKQAELQELSFKLAEASDYLTSEVRKFSVTLNPKHFRNYWKEINETKTREKVISRLKELDTPLNEFDLLNTAKDNSDDLVNTETRAMKLILQVYEVPEDQMEPTIKEYELTDYDEKLSFNEKVNLARDLLYNKAYEDNKEKIMKPIAEFQAVMTKRVDLETETARKNTNKSKLTLISSMSLTAIYLLYLVWFILYKISIPLKKYIIGIEEGEVNAADTLKHSKAISLIKKLQELTGKNINR